MKTLIIFTSILISTLSAHALKIEGFEPDDSIVYKTVGETELKTN